jgi:hypothetical protein
MMLQVEEDVLVTLVALLRLDSVLVKPQLQRLFLNLCQHPPTMEALLRMLLSLLRAPLSMDEAASLQHAAPTSSLSDALQVCSLSVSSPIAGISTFCRDL